MTVSARAVLPLRGDSMKFCCACGAPVAWAKPRGKALPRYVCTRCYRVYYQSPQLVTGCIAVADGRVLLCRRGVEPAYGLWDLPSGFVEIPERAQEGAVREVLEEANVAVDVERLYAMFHIPHINQSLLVFLARLMEQNVTPGPETLAVKLFLEEEVPWEKIAFATTRTALQHYFRDRHKGSYEFHFADIVPFDPYSISTF